MENLTNIPEYSDTEESPLSSPSNLEAIDLSDNIPSPISNLLNDKNVQQTPLVSYCISNPKNELSNRTENPTISTAESTGHHEKDLRPLEESNEKIPNPSPPSPNPPPLNHNPIASNIAEPNSESESQTPSEHSSGSEAAFYCSVGSPSEDEEDGSAASLVLGVEGEGEVESGLTERTLREVVSTSETEVATDDGGVGEYDDDDEGEEGEERNERNEIHNDSKRRKSEKRLPFLKRLFGRKKARDNDGSASAGGIS